MDRLNKVLLVTLLSVILSVAVSINLAKFWEFIPWTLLAIPILLYVKDSMRMLNLIGCNMGLCLITRYIGIPIITRNINIEHIAVGEYFTDGLTSIITQAFIVIWTVCLGFISSMIVNATMKRITTYEEIRINKVFTTQSNLRYMSMFMSIISVILCNVIYYIKDNWVSTITMCSIIFITHLLYSSITEYFRSKKANELLAIMNKEIEESDFFKD